MSIQIIIRNLLQIWRGKSRTVGMESGVMLNKATIDLIKRFEGCRLEAYQDIVGVWTIGYGHTKTAKPGLTWTQEHADTQLELEANQYAEEVADRLQVPYTPNELGAMTSLAYNIGLGAFTRSTCLDRFNGGDKEGAAEALTWFNKAGGKTVRGLVRRRAAEKELFLSK